METQQQYVHMEFFEEFEKDLLNQGEGEEVAPGEEELEEEEEKEEEEAEEEAEDEDNEEE